MYKNYFKRLFDFVVSFTLLIVVSPIFIVVFVFLFIANDGTVFFVQRRPGLNEKIFKVIKFKTMNDKRNEFGDLLPDSDRLTGIGKFVRKTSLDEIPQLINVLLGDMSLIGPRPLLERYLPYYSEIERARHSVRPGITGWAQVNGRNLLQWKNRFALDIYYVENVSFLLDLKIIFLTVKAIFTSKGLIVDPGSVLENLDVKRSR